MRRRRMTLAAALVGLTVFLGACGGDTSSSTSSDSGSGSSSTSSDSSSGPSEDSAAQAAVDYGKILLQDVGSPPDVEVTDVQLDGDSAVVYIEWPSGGAGSPPVKQFVQMGWEGDSWTVGSAGSPDSAYAP